VIRVRLIWVGREHRNDPERALCQRYRERLEAYARFEEIVLKPVTRGDLATIQQEECRRIEERCDRRDALVALDARGKTVDSPGFARRLERFAAEGRRPTFVIGGAMGLTDGFRQAADSVLSLSPMTLPHALARVVFMEQLYRALTIRAGHPYHHGG